MSQTTAELHIQSPQTPGTSSALHSGMSVSRFLGLHWFGGIFPVAAGLAFYGWRAGVVIVGVLLSVLVSTWAWRQIGRRGYQLRYDHNLWMGLLLALLLPAHLASGLSSRLNGIETGEPLWLILPSAGLLVVMFNWLLGGIGSGRIHPVMLTFLLLQVCFLPDLVPHAVLERDNLISGDILNVERPVGVPVQSKEPWHELRPSPTREAIWREPASQRLVFFTTGLEGGWQNIEGLIRDRMPPLEDLIIGGQPAPIGMASALAVIIGGLFLLYRGVIEWRIPLLMIVGAYLTMLILPVPVVITDVGPVRRWLYAMEIGVGWATAVTFVNYQILAGPLLFVALFVATAPTIRPTTRRGSALFGLLAGILAGVFQLYASVSFGACLAVLLVSAITPWLDRWLKPRPLL